MLIIDRFEGDFAIVETSEGLINVPCTDLPVGAQEGDKLTLVLDKTGTEARKERIDGMMDKLFKG